MPEKYEKIEKVEKKGLFRPCLRNNSDIGGGAVRLSAGYGQTCGGGRMFACRQL